MIVAIPLAVMLGGFATWLLMRERTNAALHLAAYYKAAYRAALPVDHYTQLVSERPTVLPAVATEDDDLWAEFLRGHR